MSDPLLVAILAAGASRRLGRPKQLVEINGEPMLHRQSRVALEASIGKVVVVVGCDHDRFAPLVADLDVQVLINREWEEGMAASVRCATRAATDNGAAALLLWHCDQYAVTSHDLIQLRDAWRLAETTPHLSRAGNYLGPPAILPARLFTTMLSLKGDTGPRAIFGDREAVIEVELPAAAMDVDTPGDLPGKTRNDP